MKLLANESVDKPIVERFRQDSRTVVYVVELHPSIDDDTVLHQANQKKLQTSWINRIIEEQNGGRC